MNNVIDFTSDREHSEFYPTPQCLAEKMISDIDFRMIQTILEPSAGKGDLLRAVARKTNAIATNYRMDIDCIEIDPNLRQILKYQFSEYRKNTMLRRIREIEQERHYDRETYKYVFQSEILKQEHSELLEESHTFFERGIHIVHDDFLTYVPFKHYDLILMNPPFSNGEKHLLKALKLQSKGGQIVCLLNAETIRNPYTELRRELVNQLEDLNASIEFLENEFIFAERKTGVEIALIKVKIESEQEESDIYKRMQEAEEMEDFSFASTELTVHDYIRSAISRFKVETKAGLELIRQYRALVPYMQDSFSENSYKKPILRLTDSTDRGYDSVSVNEYLKKVRYKYWEALLSNPKFTNRLTSTLQKEYRKRVNELENYDFTEFNIYELVSDMTSRIKSGIEDEIVVMFDRLTQEHAYYPECKKNIHLYNGWKTNQAHKIGKKVIIPSYGIFDSWDGKPRAYNAREAVEDIERILNFFDGAVTREVDLWDTIQEHFSQGVTKNIPLKHFVVTFYKKGTIHLVFNSPELIERFNIYAAQKKSWLPPNYGRVRYEEMNEEERAVVDSFQGKEAYDYVMVKKNYYLAAPIPEKMLMLS